MNILCLCLFVFPFRSLAGNSLWEEASKERREGGLSKRYYSINPANEDSNLRWPDKSVTYCFKNKASEDAFDDAIPKAMQLWYNAGLSEQEYTFKKGSAKECSNKADVVTIIKGQGLRATIGKVLPDPGSEDSDMKHGPICTLSPEPDIGLLRLHSNIAHELGHVWGLAHEHQIEATWSGALGNGYSSTFTEPVDIPNEKVFDSGIWRFHCSNLKDYNTAWQKIVTENPTWDVNQVDDEMTKLCTVYGAARQAGFNGATEYLPFPNPRESLRHGMGHGNGGVEDQVDMASIMIYNSKSGGYGDAEGRDTTDEDVDQDVDHRAIVLTRQNGDEIRKNIVPSGMDIVGIQRIYSEPETPKTPKLYTNPDSHEFNLFKKIFKKKTPDSCAEGSGSKRRTRGLNTGIVSRHWARSRHTHGFDKSHGF